MADIVERLRNTWDSETHGRYVDEDVAEEAAKEIISLRQAIVAWTLNVVATHRSCNCIVCRRLMTLGVELAEKDGETQ